MKAIALTKKQIKRAATAAAIVLCVLAVIIIVVSTSVGTKAEERMLPIYRVARGDNKVSITFDVAWENSNTDELLSILDEYGAKATFFVTGDWCDRCPEDVKKFASAGHEVANHSDKHPHIEGISVNDLINDTRECSRKIKMLTGKDPELYRAPYGEYTDSMLTTLDGMGLKVIQWDVDSVDWKKPSASEITKKVLENTKSGSIILFHNDLPNTTEALPEVLKGLKDKGYEFVTAGELIMRENYSVDATGEQQPTMGQISSITGITDEKIEAVIARYSEEIAAAGITEEQLSAAKEAIKTGNFEELPAAIRPLAEELRNKLSATPVISPTQSQAEEK